MPHGFGFSNATAAREKYRGRVSLALVGVLLLVQMIGMAFAISPILMLLSIAVTVSLGAFAYFVYSRTR